MRPGHHIRGQAAQVRERPVRRRRRVQAGEHAGARTVRHKLQDTAVDAQRDGRGQVRLGRLRRPVHRLLQWRQGQRRALPLLRWKVPPGLGRHWQDVQRGLPPAAEVHEPSAAQAVICVIRKKMRYLALLTTHTVNMCKITPLPLFSASSARPYPSAA